MKKFLIMSVVAAMTTVAPVLAQDEAQVLPQGPCPIDRCEKPAPDMGVCPERMHRPPHFDMKKFEDELNLTDKQKEELKVLREKRMEAAKPLHEKLRAAEQEACQIRKELREIRFQAKKDFESVLTDKQLKKLEKLKAERRQMFEKRHKAGMHKRPPMQFECNCGCKKTPVQE
ncbi:MAG: Spy/CpxP family protein refolding chaperone [Muribaculaceae bacterium]|nr:Spy/CpxP family protein refolding chaperone [Muribaculaceae bacterium]